MFLLLLINIKRFTDTTHRKRKIWNGILVYNLPGLYQAV